MNNIDLPDRHQDREGYLLMTMEQKLEINNRIQQEVMDEVDQIVKDEHPELFGLFGGCHGIWAAKKQHLIERGYVWYAPSEVYPGVMFD